MSLMRQADEGHSEIVLGERYRDTLHGVTGVAVSKHVYLTGCDRVVLEWVKDGEVKDQSFDVTQLELVETGKAAPTEPRRGGPGRTPPPKSTGR